MAWSWQPVATFYFWRELKVTPQLTFYRLEKLNKYGHLKKKRLMFGLVSDAKKSHAQNDCGMICCYVYTLLDMWQQLWGEGGIRLIFNLN